MTQQLSAENPTFVYTMTKKESLVIDLFIVSSVSFDADITLTMKAVGGNAIVRCIVLPSAGASIALATHQIHIAARAKSDVLVKTVIMDGSTVSFQGNVHIGRTAKKSDAYQKNENLLFGDGGIIAASPMLEILNNDVRCTHGVTTGTIPDDVLWYMQTRGMSEASAKLLYVEGFIRGSIGDIQDEQILKKLYHRE